jgi:hypothetical protein
LVTRRTSPGFLSNNEAARERKRTEDFVRSLTRTNQPETGNGLPRSTRTNEANGFVPTARFWRSWKGRIVQAIVLSQARNKDQVLKVTTLTAEEYDVAFKELLQINLAKEKDDGKLWVSRELYWRCRNYFKEFPERRDANSKAFNHSKSSKENPLGNHVSRERFLEEFFGLFGRDLGNPERWFTDNPLDLLPFMEECAENKLPAFMSVQPTRAKAKVLGFEKVFFDFDYCKNSDILDEAETQTLKAELGNEVKYFLKQLAALNIKPLVVKTRKGYHVHVYFDSVYEINQKLTFYKQVYKQLQLGLLQGYNYRFIDPVIIGDINRMCRIPLSIHEKSGEECIIVDSQLEKEKLRSVEYFKLYGLKQKDLLDAMEKARELEKNRKQKQVKYITRKLTSESITGLRSCFVKAMDSGEMCHQQRLALLQEAYSLCFHSPESIIDLFRCFNDFDESITAYQVNWFFTNQVEKNLVRPYSCQSIQKYGWCLGEECSKTKRNPYKPELNL